MSVTKATKRKSDHSNSESTKDDKKPVDNIKDNDEKKSAARLS